MIYTHVLKVGGGGVRSPVDLLPEPDVALSLPTEPPTPAIPGPTLPDETAERGPDPARFVCRDRGLPYQVTRNPVILSHTTRRLGVALPA
jgi:hypothetical protein